MSFWRGEWSSNIRKGRMPPPTAELELAIDIHNKLSILVAPATASSIRASNISTNYSLLMICILAVIAFCLLIGSTFLSVESGVLGRTTTARAIFEMIGAAGIGSAFSQLYTATDYLRNGTFDSNYNQIYLIRFALGIIAGAILGQFGPDLLQTSGGSLANVTRTTFALVGGFSAEVVYQLLKRFSDTFVTAVRGTGKDRAQATAEREITRKMSDTASQIYDAIDPTVPEQAQKRLREIATNLVLPKK